MSHLITGTLPIEGQPIFNIPQKEIVMPRVRKIIKVKTQEDKQIAQRRMIKAMCAKLSDKQYDQIHRKNEDYINIQCQKLKKKNHRHTMQRSSKIIEEIFTREDDRTQEDKEKLRKNNHINTKKYLDKMPQKVYLHQKYYNQINMRINTMQETQQITRNKENYKQWMNQHNNSPMKSPNFTRMTFLLEKLSSQPKYFQQVRRKGTEGSPNRNSQKQQQLFVNIKNLAKNSNRQSYQLAHIPNITLEPIEQKLKYKKKVKGHKIRNRHSMVDMKI